MNRNDRVEIRPMKRSDIQLIHQGLKETNWQDIPNDQKSVLKRADVDSKIIEDFERYKRSKKYKLRVFVAVEKGEPAGYVSVGVTMNPAIGLRMGSILDLYVSPGSRKRGTGGMLLDYALKFIRNQGYSHASIMVSSSNRVAKSLYERKGFLPDRITMVKNLRSD